MIENVMEMWINIKKIDHAYGQDLEEPITT